MSSAAACNTTHGKEALSFFTTTISAVLLVTTATLNAFILMVFIRNKSLWQKSVFYKLLLNITVADFLTGVIADPVSISFHTKEGLELHITKGEIILVHYTLFSINGVSILTMSLLCIDRIVALLKPLKYRNGLKNWKCYLMISLTWLLSNLLAIPYFKMGYIKYLAIFSYFTVVVTALSLVLAAIVYKKYFASFTSTVQPSSQDGNNFRISRKEASNKNMTNVKIINRHIKSVNYPNNNAENDGDENANDKIKEDNKIVRKPKMSKSINNVVRSKKMSLSEERVNKSFITLLVVFLVTYLPSVIMTTYMNLCQNCNCMFIHALRDLTFLSILSSALWRPLNFVLRLRTIRREMKKLLGYKNLSVLPDESKLDSIPESSKA
ncbi:uncharacterized protein LOC130625414 [Hydractinia symbiolongicarpus]|uniref:uncharacterized protein LOC130625414 n=1 Tax=Hydractinia symbiolongicarpus TaxID=13093 RepID=UPI002550B8AA|nr:uncharacterized protein LOC130625414 [Hydractinia symbiolongicarpus]XP_057296492.1 uncharacterized protein LOC130625414 [Hydractinia symbiolongicarpus]